jgi:transposase
MQNETIVQQTQTINEQTQTINELNKTIDEQTTIIKKIQKKNNELQEKIVELERKLGLNSQNSSKPPTTDGLRRQKSLRHENLETNKAPEVRKGFTLHQIKNPDKITICHAEICDSCQKTLENEPIVKVIKRQVFDIPDPKIIVSEYQAEVKVCKCGNEVCGKFPENVEAPVQYGKNISAFVVYMLNKQLIPEDRLSELVYNFTGMKMATSTIANLVKKFSNAIKDHQNKVLEELKLAPIKHLDETGFRIAGTTKWLHVISNDTQTHYRVSDKRGEILENVLGIIVHDHWKPYYKMNATHALCNAHHLRELNAIIEFDKESWANELKQLLLEALKKPDTRYANVSSLFDEIVGLGLKYHESLPPPSKEFRHKRTAHNFLIRMKKFKSDVLRFLENRKIPFTNNQAERDIRMMKLRQKISGGFRSMAGAESFCIIRGFISTVQKQGGDIFSSIVKYC